MTEHNGDHLFVPIATKSLASATDDDGCGNTLHHYTNSYNLVPHISGHHSWSQLTPSHLLYGTMRQCRLLGILCGWSKTIDLIAQFCAFCQLYNVSQI